MWKYSLVKCGVVCTTDYFKDVEWHLCALPPPLPQQNWIWTDISGVQTLHIL